MLTLRLVHVFMIKTSGMVFKFDVRQLISRDPILQ